MAEKTTVILGGGVGGLVTANDLRRRLGTQHRVVLVERNDQFFFQPGYLWLMVGMRRRPQVSRPLTSLLSKGVDLVPGEVMSLDPVARNVTVNDRQIDFDYLVIALGAELAPGAMPGFPDTALNLYDVDGAQSVLPALESLSDGAVAVVISSLPYKCPAAPYEAALLVDGYLRRQGKRDRTKLALYTPEPAPLPVAGPEIGNMVKDLLSDRDIEAHFNTQTNSMDPTGRTLLLNEGEPESFDLVLGIPAHKAPSVVAASGLGNEAGWVPVDAGTMETTTPDVFAIGDVTTITLANGKPLPKAGVFAHGQASVVAETIATRIAGSGESARFDGMGWCFLETGDRRAGFAAGNFYAEPDPQIALQYPARRWHWGKQLLDYYWMSGGLRGQLAGTALRVGGRLFNVPVDM